MGDEADRQTRLAMSLSLAIQPLLAGHSSFVQGAALADLFSLWLAGHMFAGDAHKTEELREGMFEEWIATVRKLVPESEAELRKCGFIGHS